MNSEFAIGFAIIGAPRCGTTSLFGALQAHPEINLTTMVEKELDLFNDTETFQLGPGYWQHYYRKERGLIGNCHTGYLTSKTVHPD